MRRANHGRNEWASYTPAQERAAEVRGLWWRGFAWGLVGALVLTALVAFAVPARGDVTLAPEHRVGNRRDHGVCWWACAQTIGHHAGIVPLQGIVDKVVQTGVGFQGGATAESIEHWNKTLGLKAEGRQPGTKDHGFLTDCLKRGLPVIVGVHPWGPEQAHHAILLLRIGREKEHWQDANKVPYHDYLIRYFDPNHPSDTYVTTWSAFWARWTGRAYAFDPRQQDPAVVAPEPRSGRLMLNGGRHSQPPRVPAQVVPTRLQDLPYVVPLGPVPLARKVPSNQDLKDGVNRPADTLSYPSVFAGHDYHAEGPRR